MVYMVVVVVGMIMVVFLIFSLISGSDAPPAAFGGADLNSVLPPGGTTFPMKSVKIHCKSMEIKRFQEISIGQWVSRDFKRCSAQQLLQTVIGCNIFKSCSGEK